MSNLSDWMLAQLWPIFSELGKTAKVTDKQRKVAHLRLECQRSWQDIGDEMGVSWQAVRTHFLAWLKAINRVRVQRPRKR